MPGGLYVQYGSGFSAPPGWRSFDASPTLALERLPIVGGLVRKNDQPFPSGVERGDIVAGLPIAPDSCRGVFASHVLEHLALEDAHVALRNTHAMLAPGGTFRVVVPDLRVLAERYVASKDADAARRFMEASGLGARTRPRGAKARIVDALGHSRHLWMWDRASLDAALAAARFEGMRPCTPGDSGDRHFDEVEDPSRFVDAIAIACTKPTRTND